MRAFEEACAIERKGVRAVSRFLKRAAYDGRFVWLLKGRMARHLQATVGDAIVNTDERTFWTVEVKTEQRYTGNLFIETWSNRDFKRGWLFSLRADLLLYYFLDRDELYILPLPRLQAWASDGDIESARLMQFRLVAQKARKQLNETCGHIVPLSVLRREVGYRLVYPSQIPLNL